MKRALIALGTVAVALAILLVIEAREKDKLSEQIAALNAQLSNHGAQDLAALREKCAQQSAQRFRQLGYSESANGLSSASYANHYNTKFSKCFMTLEINDLGAQSIITRFLFDAYEQREYAEYSWVPSKTKKYWEQPPIICVMAPSAREKRFCRSEDEYNSFVARYME